MTTNTLLFHGKLARKMLPDTCKAKTAEDLEMVERTVTEIFDHVLEDRGETHENPGGQELLTSLRYFGISKTEHSRFCPVCT